MKAIPLECPLTMFPSSSTLPVSYPVTFNPVPSKKYPECSTASLGHIPSNPQDTPGGQQIAASSRHIRQSELVEFSAYVSFNSDELEEMSGRVELKYLFAGPVGKGSAKPVGKHCVGAMTTTVP